jgi:hypothetical protein
LRLVKEIVGSGACTSGLSSRLKGIGGSGLVRDAVAGLDVAPDHPQARE